jgi:hypothetical protein
MAHVSVLKSQVFGFRENFSWAKNRGRKRIERWSGQTDKFMILMNLGTMSTELCGRIFNRLYDERNVPVQTAIESIAIEAVVSGIPGPAIHANVFSHGFGIRVYF